MGGRFGVPEEIRRYSASVRVTANVDDVYNDVLRTYYVGDQDGPLDLDVKEGNNTLDWLKLSKDASEVNVDFGPGWYSSVSIDYYTIEYRYKALV
jgi:hypothetical protein